MTQRPGRGSCSMRALIEGSKPGAFWISSRTTGARVAIQKTDGITFGEGALIHLVEQNVGMALR